MSDSDSSSDRDPFEGLADSFLARFRAGERPSIEEYAAKYPDQADAIRRAAPGPGRAGAGRTARGATGTDTGHGLRPSSGAAPRSWATT